MWVEEVLTGGQLQEHDVNVVILQLLSHHYPPRHTHTHQTPPHPLQQQF